MKNRPAKTNWERNIEIIILETVLFQVLLSYYSAQVFSSKCKTLVLYF